MFRVSLVISSIALVFYSGVSYSAEDQENRIGLQIHDRFWMESEFPLQWFFDDDGVVNNTSIDPTTPAVTNADAQAQVQAAITPWTDVTTANLSLSYGGETTTSTTGCDRENIVTWADTLDFAVASGRIARGITTQYTGASFTVDDTNRNSLSCGGSPISLSSTSFPNGSTLSQGAILDMDMSYNSTNFDFVTTPNATSAVSDIAAIGVHEFGHMLSLSHSSLSWTSNVNRATMYPAASTANITSQNNIRTLELDDIVSIGRRYSSTGFWPTGSAPFSTGAITGTVTQPDGTPAEGIRVWAYEVAETTFPVVESFSATSSEADASILAGTYILPGLPAGDYFVCIVPWLNGVQNNDDHDPSGNHYNRTANDYNTSDFYTECYDNEALAVGVPNFSTGVVDAVSVVNGSTVTGIDFTTSRKSDIMLVMDVSGSMNLLTADGSETKLAALKSSADQFTDYIDLAGGHRLGLVQFNAGTPALTPVFDLQELVDASDAIDAIDAMTAFGGTNIIGGVSEAVSQITTVALPNPRRVMVLFTDGRHNTPAGSDLNDIRPNIIDNDIVLYSIGFGADLDTSILEPIANDSGGSQTVADSLLTNDLNKLFQNAAALAVDETLLIDPDYRVSVGKPAVLPVSVGLADESVTFLLNWETDDPKRIESSVISPAGCQMKQTDANTRSGDSHRFIRIDFPVICNGKSEHGGRWNLTAEGSNMRLGDHEPVQISVMGASTIRLQPQFEVSRQSVQISASLSGGVDARDVKVFAELIPPTAPTMSSTLEDTLGTDLSEVQGKRLFEKRRKEQQPVDNLYVSLIEQKQSTDKTSTRKVFSTKLADLATGTWQVRLISRFSNGDQRGTQRESLGSFTISE